MRACCVDVRNRCAHAYLAAYVIMPFCQEVPLISMSRTELLPSYCSRPQLLPALTSAITVALRLISHRLNLVLPPSFGAPEAMARGVSALLLLLAGQTPAAQQPCAAGLPWLGEGSSLESSCSWVGLSPSDSKSADNRLRNLSSISISGEPAVSRCVLRGC